MTYDRLRFVLGTALLLVASACSGSTDEPSAPSTSVPPPTSTSELPASTTSTSTTAPPATATPVPNPTPAPTSPPAAEPSAEVIFYNGPVLTMEPDKPEAEALAVRGDTIVAVGDMQDVMALAGPETVLIDLAGNAIMPGFVDAHLHPFSDIGSAETVEADQQRLLAGGLTTVGELAMWPGKLDRLQRVMEQIDLRVRIVGYLLYNTKCAGTIDQGWILDRSPDLDPQDMLTIPGVKLFLDSAGDPANCGWPEMSVELPPDFVAEHNSEPFGADLYTEDELTELIVGHQALGFQVAMHSRGDVTVETALNAIERALDGQPNTHRHRIDHNDFLRPDLLSRYGEVGAIPTVRGRPLACSLIDSGGIHSFGEAVHPWLRVARSLIEANPELPVAWHSDTFGSFYRRPIVDLYNLVTKRATRVPDGSECEPPDWLAAEAVTVETALRMMTINSAYALWLDDYVGSLRPGKFADLIILSRNPLTIDTDEIINIEVTMTMVGGTAEFCLPGHEELCP